MRRLLPVPTWWPGRSASSRPSPGGGVAAAGPRPSGRGGTRPAGRVHRPVAARDCSARPGDSASFRSVTGGGSRQSPGGIRPPGVSRGHGQVAVFPRPAAVPGPPGGQHRPVGRPGPFCRGFRMVRPAQGTSRPLGPTPGRRAVARLRPFRCGGTPGAGGAPRPAGCPGPFGRPAVPLRPGRRRVAGSRLGPGVRGVGRSAASGRDFVPSGSVPGRGPRPRAVGTGPPIVARRPGPPPSRPFPLCHGLLIKL